jgi:hypothetical protein
MTGAGMQHLLASLAIAAPLALGVAVTPSGPEGHRVFAFEDPAITEASALVVDRGLFLTSNDSGHPGDVYAVDHAGATVGITHWSDHPDDTEALAPAGQGYVWVGDIGDNVAERSSVDITRVPVGRGNRDVNPTIYKLVYPDGPTNAETLLRNPTTGRLYIASKNIFGGVLYAVPAQLDPSRPNTLQAIGRVLPVATDGSFFPDGKHLVIRAYTSAVVYDWPSLQPVGRFALPAERQGEGIAVADDGRVYLSSEGPHSPVLEVSLPHKIAAAVQGEPSIAPASPATTGASDPSSGNGDPGSRDPWPWVAGGLLGAAAILVLIRALRPR